MSTYLVLESVQIGGLSSLGCLIYLAPQPGLEPKKAKVRLHERRSIFSSYLYPRFGCPFWSLKKMLLQQLIRQVQIIM